MRPKNISLLYICFKRIHEVRQMVTTLREVLMNRPAFSVKGSVSASVIAT